MPSICDRRAGPTALTILTLSFACVVATAAAEALTLEAAQGIPAERDAGRAARESDSSAMQDMAVSAGQLPDPEARVGAINVPLIKFSVDLFTSLHQPASVITAEGPKMAAVYLTPLLVSGLGHALLFGGLVMTHMRTQIRERRIARLTAQALEG